MKNSRPSAQANPPEATPRSRLVAVVEDDCTGCNTCVDYCLVDCIEAVPPAPIHIREDECIGCFVCVKVCEELALNAIHLVPTKEAGSGSDDGNRHRTIRLPLAKAAP